MITKVYDLLKEHEIAAIHHTTIRNVEYNDLTISELQELYLALRMKPTSTYNAITALYFLIRRVEIQH